MDPKEEKLSSEHEPEFSQIVYGHRDALVEHVERGFHFTLPACSPTTRTPRSPSRSRSSKRA